MAKKLIIPRFVSALVTKTKQHVKSAADFSAICWRCKWNCSLKRAVWQSPRVCCSLSHGKNGGGLSLVSSLSPANWNEACLGCWGLAERSGHCSFCLADYRGGGVGRYYEEWWAGVGGSLRCKVLHLVPHWAVKRWGPNRWWNSPSETSHSLRILTQGTQFKVCGQACIRWLVPLVLSALNGRSRINIIDIAQMNYLSRWTADVSFRVRFRRMREGKKFLDASRFSFEWWK